MATIDAPDILPVLRDWDEPVATAKQIADELDFSRQYIDRELRRFEAKGVVESVELGPARGWYVPSSIERFDQLVSDVHVYSHPHMLCRVCNEKQTEGAEALVLFERAGQNWEPVDNICAEHAQHPDYIGSMNMSNYVEGAGNYVDFAVVKGVYELRENTEAPQRRDNTYLADAEILQFVKGFD